MINVETVEKWIVQLEKEAIRFQRLGIDSRSWPDEREYMARNSELNRVIVMLSTGVRDHYKDAVEKQNLEYSPKWD